LLKFWEVKENEKVSFDRVGSGRFRIRIGAQL
jgi:hypothetical protein